MTGSSGEHHAEADGDVEASRAPTLLVVDDDETFRGALGAALGRRGFAVTLAASPAEAEAEARRTTFEYAIVDVRMPGGSGIDLCAALKAIDEGTRVVVLTGYGSIANAVAAMRAGAVDYLTKPTDAQSCERALLGNTPEVENVAIPSLDRVEFEYLSRVVADCEGNISEAARRLRMHRRSLQRKISRLPPAR